MIIPNQRHLFDIPADIVYLNSAAQSPLLRSVRRTGKAGVMRKAHPWTDFRERTAAEGERLRGPSAQSIGATADDVPAVFAVKAVFGVKKVLDPREPRPYLTDMLDVRRTRLTNVANGAGEPRLEA